MIRLKNKIISAQSIPPHLRYFIKISHLLIFLILIATSYCQIINFKNYSTKDGLPSNEVYHVIQDTKGYMWFATDFGVSRFDGYNFTNYNSKDGLPDNTVLEIYEDYKGRIWFVSSSAKLSFYYNDSIFNYWNNTVFLNTIKDIPNIINKSFSVDEKDNVYLGIYRKGHFKISKEGKIEKRFSKYPIDYDALIIEKNKLYFNIPPNIISTNQQYIIRENNSFKVKIDPEEFPGRRLALLGLNKEVYYSYNSTLYCIYDSLHIIKHHFDKDNIILLNSDQSKNLWVGTYYGGIYCFKNGDVSAEPELHLLDGDAASNIVCDKEGGYWISSLKNGVYYFPSIKIKTYTTNDGLTGNILNFLTSDGKIIFGNELLSPYLNIISCKELHAGQAQIKKVKPINDPNALTYAIFFDNKDNALWIGTSKSFYKYKDGKYTNFSTFYSLPDSLIHPFNGFAMYEMVRDSSGNIWVGSNGGLLKINNNKIYQYPSKEFFLRVYSLQEDVNNSFWLGCKNGLYKFIDGKYVYYGNKNPLLKNRITSIKKSKVNNSLWIATKGAGILIMKGDSVKQILQKDGLLSNHIKHLFIDKNIIWASSNSGLNKITISLQNNFSYTIEGFTQADGLASNEVNCVLSIDNLVYVATNDGLCVFNGKEITTNKTPPPVYITSLKIMNRDTSVLNSYSLPYNQNFIEIDFVGLTYRTAGDVMYKYRLTGIDDQWEYSKSTKVSYPFLPDGEYKFEVYAVNKDGICSNTPAVILFHISPPFWKTWWFICIVFLLVAGLIWLFIYIRIKAIKKQNALKSKLNKYMQQALRKQMNPHFIFNSLNSIQYYILKNDKLESNKYLAKFARLMRIILNNSQQQQISIQEELDALRLYIELESLRFKEKFEYSITVDEKLDTNQYKIPPLLIQPYVENAIWHGLMHKDGNGILSVDLCLNDSIITCTITDNGIGREKAAEIKKKKTKTYESHGTKITGDRLKLINTLNNTEMKINYFDLKDESGNAIGTKVEITIPLIK